MKKAPGLLLAFFLTLFLLPVGALVFLSFLPPQTAQAVFEQKAAPGMLRLTLEQFACALGDDAYGRQFRNSILITGASLAFAMPVALGAGLFLSRLPRRWQRPLLILYVLSLLSPFQIIMLPVYRLSLMCGLYDSYFSVILLNTFSPIGPLTVCVLLRTVDDSQWEAASLETDSALQILRHVLLPQIAPGMGALALLFFAQVWNMVEQPLILLPDERLRPLSTAFNDIVRGNTDYAFSGALLYALPVLAFYLTAAALSARARRSAAR